jgi:hypothetical protein
MAYPSAFRVRFAEHMLVTFLAELDAARGLGRIAVARCWATAVWDAACLGTVERFDALVDEGLAWPRALHRPLAFLLTTVVCGACLGIAMAMTHVVSLVARPNLGVVDPAHVAVIYRLDPVSQREVQLSLGDLERLRAETSALSHVAGYMRMPVEIGTGGGVRTLTAEVVSPDYFETLGVGTTGFGGPGAVWLSPRLARQLGGRAAFGIVVNDVAYAVAGTVPEGFAGVNFDWQQAPDLWLPVSSLPDLHPGFAALSRTQLEAVPLLVVVARQRNDAPGAQVRVAVERALRPIDAQASLPAVASRVLRLHDATTYPGQRRQLSRALAVVSVVAVLAFLLGVSTLVAYLSATVVDRDRESALRASLGATPWRLTRDVVTLTLPAAVASMTAAVAVLLFALDRAGTSLATLGVPALSATVSRPTGRLVLIVIAVAATATLLAQLGVVRRVQRIAQSPTPLLRTGATIAASRWRLGVVCLQAAIAASVALPCAQYTAAWRAAVSAPPGFDTSGLTLVDVEASARRSTSSGKPDYPSVLDDLRRDPAIAAAAVAAFGPWSKTRAYGRLEVRSTSRQAQVPVEFNAVDRDYFESIGVARQAGRTFAAASDGENATAVVINQTLAAALGSPGEAIGMAINLTGTSGYEGSATVVGVVADLTYHAPWEAPVAMVYVPLTRTAPPHATLIVRTRAPLDADVRVSIEQAVERSLPGTTVRRTATWWRHVREVLARERFLTALLLGLAIVTASASMVGLWSALREHLHAQTRNTAIRVALGATFRFLVRPTMGRPLAAVALGLTVGVLGGLVINYHVAPSAPGPGVWLWTGSFMVLLMVLQMLSGATVAYRLRRVRPAALLRHTL